MFDSEVTTENQGLESHGRYSTHCFTLLFRKGYMVQTQTVPGATTRHLVLVLNAHEAGKLATARPWLDMLPSLPVLENVGLVVLGREDCNNDWLKPCVLHRVCIYIH